MAELLTKEPCPNCGCDGTIEGSAVEAFRQRAIEAVREVRRNWIKQDDAHVRIHGTECHSARELPAKAVAAEEIVTLLQSLPATAGEQKVKRG